MVIILTNDGDVSSDIVIDWLKYFDHPFLRINTSDLLDHDIRVDVIAGKKASFKIDDKYVNICSVGAVWYRKFGFFRRSTQAQMIERETNAYTVGHISTEFSKVMETIANLFEHSFWLTNPTKINLVKPVVLKIAEKHGLNVPKTYIVNNKQDLRCIMNHSTIISKSVYDPMSIIHDDSKFLMFTKKVTSDLLDSLPDRFIPSMVQEYIEKKFEIRTFYLDGKCYSMAILSQKDSQTQLDYRKYNIKKPNRFIPIQLPKVMEGQISKLMNDVGLNTGSLDFIVKPDDSIIFLEINPTGQFGMVDFPCNYGLHCKVAELLIKKDRLYEQNNTL